MSDGPLRVWRDWAGDVRGGPAPLRALHPGGGARAARRLVARVPALVPAHPRRRFGIARTSPGRRNSSACRRFEHVLHPSIIFLGRKFPRRYCCSAMPERDGVDAIIDQWRRERPELDPSPIGSWAGSRGSRGSSRNGSSPSTASTGSRLAGMTCSRRCAARPAVSAATDRPHRRDHAHVERDDEAARQARAGRA